MRLPLSRAITPELQLLPRTGSTNDELKRQATGLPEFAVIATANQTAGRGRLGRSWIAPDGTALAVSVLLRPRLVAETPVPMARLAWIPLLAGLAMVRTVAAMLPGREVWIKWPNDVLVDGLKASGLLVELAPPDGLVVGAGVNLEMKEADLPTDAATSLLLAGVRARGSELIDLTLSGYLGNLRELYLDFLASGADAEASGLRRAVSRACSTIGSSVRVELPGGDRLVGTAEDIDESGRLVVRGHRDGVLQSVAAGDVTHLRYE